MLYKSTLRDMHAHAIDDYPRECCGVVVTVGRRQKYIRCRNTSPLTDSFVMHADDYAQAEETGPVIAIVHSHPDDNVGATESDRVGCQQSGIPWYVVEVAHNGEVPVILRTLRVEPDDYQAPLLGRPFFHGTLDCYSLIRDWYKRERGIDLPDFERADKWWEGDEELYLDNFEKAGFRKLRDSEPLQVGDVILMQHQSKRVNHGGVYIDGSVPTECANSRIHPMGGMMLHHLYGRPSERVLYGGYWQQITRATLRYIGGEHVD